MIPAFRAAFRGLALSALVPLIAAARAAEDVQPGPYAGDARFEVLAAGWPQRVERARERLAIVTGLGFEESGPPRVILSAHGDERVPFEIRAQVLEGRRSVRLHVNAEPLLGGVLDVDRTLLRALAAAAFEDAARRHGGVPRWLVFLAGTAAAGDLDAQIEKLHRRGVEGDATVARVDPRDPDAAAATGCAALLLLAASAEPGEVRRLLTFASQGDDGGALLGRMARAPDGRWVDRARGLFNARLRSLDAEPWRLLLRARAALADTGAAGMEAVLPETIPPAVADEIAVLRAQAAADQGDLERARALLAALRPRAAAGLADPAGALALRIRVESARGGDAALARRLALQLDRDFPRSAARAALREDFPMLGMEEDPQRWMQAVRERVRQQGSGALDLRTIDRFARTLLQDHRAGAAERFLDGLGPRREAPELAGVLAAVHEAQQDPSAAARARAAARVSAWREDPGEARAADVRDGGRASIPALRETLRTLRGAERRGVIRLLAQCAGPAGALWVMEREWQGRAGLVAVDLVHLSTTMAYAHMRAGLADDRLRALGVPDVERLWEDVRLGLPEDWLADRPGFLRSLRHEDYPVRHAALETLMDAGQTVITPQVVGFALQDAAALQRQFAVRLAGRAGFRALARLALKDDAWLVREEAARVIAQNEGAQATETLIGLLQGDESTNVRAAAAGALLRVAREDPQALAALLRTQVGEDPRLRDAVASALAQAAPLPVADAIASAWARAVERKAPHRGFLIRTALLFQRLTGVDLGYQPGATNAELRAMLARMRTWVAKERARAAARAGGGTGR